MDLLLYRQVMKVLENAGTPPPVLASVDAVFHAPAVTYNPDDYTPPNQYPVWLAAGRPTHDVKGRELDVRGQLTGGQFSPFDNPGEPGAAPGDGEKAPYVNVIEVAPPAVFPPDGLWRVSLPTLQDSASQPITIPDEWPYATLYCGDPGFAFMEVEVEGVGVISNGTPQCPFPGKAGTYQVTVKLINDNQGHGAGPVGIYVRQTP